MDFVKNLKVTHIIMGGGVGSFVSLRRIAYEKRHVAHPLHLNPFVTIEKMEPRNYD